MRLQLLVTLLCLGFLSSTLAEEYEWATEQPIGSDFPTLTATDQYGREWATRDMAGENGFVFMFSRSVDW